MDAPAVRTKEIAAAEVRYAITYGELNERFWRRFDTLLNLVQIGTGALALAGWLAQGTAIAGIAGLVLACVSALQLTLGPLQRAIGFRDARVRFHDLNARAPELSLAEIDRELERLRAAAPIGITALAMPAMNIIEQRHGHQARPLRWPERLALLMA